MPFALDALNQGVSLDTIQNMSEDSKTLAGASSSTGILLAIYSGAYAVSSLVFGYLGTCNL